MKKIITYSLLVLFLVSCGLSDAYIRKIRSDLKELELENHQSCVAQGAKFGKWSDVSTEFYWECRYNYMKAQIIPNAQKADQIQRNIFVKEVNDKIIKNLQRAKRATMAGIENDIEIFDHSKCLQQGYTIDTNDQGKNEEYYKCRARLMEERSPQAPGVTNSYRDLSPDGKLGKTQLHNVKSNKTRSGEVDFVIGKMGQHPNCQHVNVKSIFFKKCVAAQKKAYFCYNDIRTLKAKKMLNDRIYCQQQSFIQFPDDQTVTRNKSAKQIEDMLRRKRERKIEELKMQKEADINRTKKFFEDGYVSQDKIFSRKSDTQNVKEAQSEREGLFNKIQILSLRQEFIETCNQSLGGDMPEYIKQSEEKCADISKDWNKVE